MTEVHKEQIKSNEIWKNFENEKPGIADIVTFKFKLKDFSYYRMGAYRGYEIKTGQLPNPTKERLQMEYVEIELQALVPGNIIWQERFLNPKNIFWMKLS